MNCKEVHKKLNRYMEKHLSDKDSLGLVNHISTCNSCQSLIDKVESTIESVGSKERLQADPFMFTRISQQIENAGSPSISIYKRAIQPIAIAIVFAAGIYLGIGMGNKFYTDQSLLISESTDTDLQFVEETFLLNTFDQEIIEIFLLNEE